MDRVRHRDRLRRCQPHHHRRPHGRGPGTHLRDHRQRRIRHHPDRYQYRHLLRVHDGLINRTTTAGPASAHHSAADPSYTAFTGSGEASIWGANRRPSRSQSARRPRGGSSASSIWRKPCPGPGTVSPSSGSSPWSSRIASPASVTTSEPSSSSWSFSSTIPYVPQTPQGEHRHPHEHNSIGKDRTRRGNGEGTVPKKQPTAGSSSRSPSTLKANG
ncbi:hypothetical protein ACFFX0_03735 [Citricoccus parietis]|uniref:Uncharacterized protein n=1 Tax=Citricoccus parietis TaxID=592307 RepID=A0ABV5FUH5_9MICC